MNLEECLRTLGVSAHASEEQLRQAYLDRVRVWHPDRFQSDPRLRLVAEEQLRRVNQAYEQLKDRWPPGGRSAPPPPPRSAPKPPPAPEPPPRPPEPPHSAPRPAQAPRSARDFGVFFAPHKVMEQMLSRRAAYGLMLVTLCAAPLLTALRIRSIWHFQVLDNDLIASRMLRPQILSPAGIIDPAGDAHVATDTLSEWARGEAIDLWKPKARYPAESAAGVGRPAPAAPSRPVRPVSVWDKAAGAGAAGQALPESGTELLRTGRLAGAGDLRITNRTELEVIALLVRGASEPLRAVYIRPGASAVIQRIHLGMYYLHVKAGRGLDAPHLRFRSDSFQPEPLGPFEFMEISSAGGTSGQHYDVVLNGHGN